MSMHEVTPEEMLEQLLVMTDAMAPTAAILLRGYVTALYEVVEAAESLRRVERGSVTHTWPLEHFIDHLDATLSHLNDLKAQTHRYRGRPGRG